MTTRENAPEGSAAPTPDPGLAPLLEMLNAPGVPRTADLSPEEARASFTALNAVGGPPAEGVSAVDRTIPGPAGDLPIRIVRPDEGTPTGALVWFHGGGFVIGDLDTADDTTRRLARAARCVVVSVDYRLAPEHRAPAAVEDCVAATAWVAANREALGLDTTAPVAVGGDSAGGNLAAVCAQRAASGDGPPLAAQLLVYPVVDLDMTGEAHPSYAENGEGLFLTADTMVWFAEHYLGPDADPTDPSVAPLRATDEALAATPPAIVVIADFDPLRDEGLAYAERLEALGVEVDLLRHPTMIHGFWGMGGLTAVAGASIEAAATTLVRFFDAAP